MKIAKTEQYLLKSIQMRKCQYFGHLVRAAKLQKTVDGRKIRRHEEDGKTEEMLERCGTDGDRLRQCLPSFAFLFQIVLKIVAETAKANSHLHSEISLTWHQQSISSSLQQ